MRDTNRIVSNNEIKNSSLVPVAEIQVNPNNRNKHPEEQIQRLMEIIKYQGWRHPLIVSKQSGLLVVGHGRLEAAKRMGLTHVPVSVQEFESPEHEYAFAVSDNAVASWAELDLSGINADLQHLDGDFNLDLLGIKNFILEPTELLPTEEATALDDQFIVSVKCRSETDQQKLFEELQLRGYDCNLIS